MIARYAIVHRIRFAYDAPVRSEVMTLHLCPLRDRVQVVRSFSVRTDPDGPLYEFIDPFGNSAHFLDRARTHEQLEIVARSSAEVGPVLPAPERLPAGGWEALREARSDVDLWPMLHASEYVRSSPALERFIAAHGLAPGNDPLASARELRARLFRIFEYVPGSTTADSPIEVILETGRGVCQDYAHVMASILRKWGIPCRYVSGYLAPIEENVTTGESHAWVEAMVPGGRLARFRPDQRHRGGRTARPGGGRPGLRGCPADPGSVPRHRPFPSRDRGDHRALVSGFSSA